MNKKRPKVGIGVLVLKDGKVLLGKRKGSSHGKGEYGSQGGHLEFGESFIECIKREVYEEAGIEIENIRFLTVTNIKRYQGNHYVDIGFVADWKSGEPQVLEPHRVENWEWFDLDNLPKSLFEPVEYYIEALKTGKNFFDG